MERGSGQDVGYALLERALAVDQTEAMLMVRLFMEEKHAGIDSIRAAEYAARATVDWIPDTQLYARLVYMDRSPWSKIIQKQPGTFAWWRTRVIGRPGPP